MSALAPLAAARMLLRAAGRKRSIHDVADAFDRQVFLVVNAAFMSGKKAYKSGGVDSAVKAIRAALEAGLPKPLAACLAAGGTAAIGSLGRGTNAGPRALGDLPGHEFHGNQWTEGGGMASSSFNIPENFKLKDAEYDVNTKIPLNLMVVASVDLSLLSSGYQNDYRVREMTKVIKEGAKFPPLTLEQKKDGSLSILDGQTRVAAFREAGIKGRVPAVIRLYDKGTEDRLPKGAAIDRKRTTSLRAAGVSETSLRALKPPALAKVGFRFDAKHKATVAWSKKHAAEMIDDITETSRKRIKAAIVNIVEGEDWNAQYDRILAAVGDEDRAYLIARHESMLAASEGQRQAWEQATEAGLLTGKEKRAWITTPDKRLCEICEELDGKTADMDGEYPGGYDGPPAHVECRCTEGLA